MTLYYTLLLKNETQKVFREFAFHSSNNAQDGVFIGYALS